jgi:hypothetical protein
MTINELRKIKEIRNHLGELHDKWSKDVKNGGDGHCKSNEGYVGIVYRLPNWFECDSKEEYQNSEPKLDFIEIYSYLFGPNRLHQFNSVKEAHKEVMSWNYK